MPYVTPSDPAQPNDEMFPRLSPEQARIAAHGVVREVQAVSIVLVLVISCFLLLSRGTYRPSLRRTKLDSLKPAAYRPLTPEEASKLAQGSESRELEDRIPRHLPIAVRLKAEKENKFRDLRNEKWVREFELEVKNTGDKPIYFIQFDLAPDLGKPPTERTLTLTIQYGRNELAYFETVLTAEDIPIKPGEKVFLKIRPDEMDGWDHFKEVELWPEHWSKPKKVSLFFEALSFGDGTGFEGGDGTPHERRK